MQYLLKPMLLAVLTVFGAALTIDTTLKPGSYTVEQLQSGILALSSSDNKEHQFAMTFPGDSDRQSHEPHLVFIRYGSEAFLKKVVLSSDEDCDELPESSRERDLIKNQASGAELSLLIQPAL